MGVQRKQTGVETKGLRPRSVLPMKSHEISGQSPSAPTNGPRDFVAWSFVNPCRTVVSLRKITTSPTLNLHAPSWHRHCFSSGRIQYLEEKINDAKDSR